MTQEQKLLLYNIGTSILDLLQENSELKKEVEYLRKCQKENDEFNAQMLEQQRKNIGSILGILINLK